MAIINFLAFHFMIQQRLITEKECEDSKNLIPELEENIPKLQKLLRDKEKVLEEIKENSKGDLIFFL